MGVDPSVEWILISGPVEWIQWEWIHYHGIQFGSDRAGAPGEDNLENLRQANQFAFSSKRCEMRIGRFGSALSLPPTGNC